MHIVPEFEPVKVVWFRTEKVQIFHNRRILDSYLKQFNKHWVNQLHSKNQNRHHTPWWWPANAEDWPAASISLKSFRYPPDLALTDIWGKPLFQEDFQAFQVEQGYSGPSWHPGSKRNYGGHCFRHPRSQATNRQFQGMAFDQEEFEDLDVRVSAGQVHRLARRNRPLPTAWDDLRISARHNRNWKRFRKTQYKNR